MTVLVTGGAGYIGSHVALELLDAGEKVTVIDNLSTGFRCNTPHGASLVVGDIGDSMLTEAVIRQHGVDAIMHFAGSSVVPESIHNPLQYYHNNTTNSRALIEVAVKTGVPHFIFSSTAAVYGAPKVAPVSEQTNPAPISPYGSSKWMTEIMLRDAGMAHDLRAVALRYFNVAGADPKGRVGQSTSQATHLVKVACETALGIRSHMDVFGTDYPTPDGTCIRDYVHVTDLARAHIAALRYLRQGGQSEVYNCGNSKGYSVLEVIEAVKRASNRDFEVRYASRRPGDSPIMLACCDKISAALCWQAGYSEIDQIVAHALRWESGLNTHEPRDQAALLKMPPGTAR